MASLDEPITVTFVPALLCQWFILVLVGGGVVGLLLRGTRATIVWACVIGAVGGLLGAAAAVALQIDLPEIIEGGPSIRYVDLLVVAGGALVVGIFDRVIRRPPPGNPNNSS
jgi:hypothetical protein